MSDTTFNLVDLCGSSSGAGSEKWQHTNDLLVVGNLCPQLASAQKYNEGIHSSFGLKFLGFKVWVGMS